MYNLLVSGRGWAPARDEMFVERLLEYTEPPLIQRFRPRGQVDFAALCRLPTLFLDETSGDGEQQAVRVGTITRARLGVREVMLEYTFESAAPPLTNAVI